MVSLAKFEGVLDCPIGVLNRMFTAREIRAVARMPSAAACGRLAAAFAAKEAAFKSLSNLLRNARQGYSYEAAFDAFPAEFREVEVLGLHGCAPRATLTGESGKTARRMGVHGVDIGIAHDGDMVVAVAFCCGVPWFARAKHGSAAAKHTNTGR
jgi:phosphopantetheine--protein transferase-like protein